MKRLIYLLFAFICVGCVGQKDEVLKGDLEFVVDKHVLLMDSGESAVFSVFFAGTEVTGECQIFDVTDGRMLQLQGGAFVPGAPGTYHFQAYYMGVATPVVEVQVMEQGSGEKGDFLRKHLILKFTATWCVNCPNMTDAIKSVKSGRAGRVIDIAVHYIDDFEVPAGKVYAQHFGVSAIPVAVVDLDKSTQTSIASATLLSNSIDKADDSGIPACGIKIASAKVGDELVVDVEGTMAVDGKYRLAVAILEDGIVKAQTGGGSDYVHNGVLRGMFQEPAMGEELGVCSGGDVVSRKYRYPAADFAVDGNYRLVAFVLKESVDGSYIVDNIAECKLYGSVGYLYQTNKTDNDSKV